MRLLVTGATGQIGSYACELLLARGHEVVGVGSPASKRALPDGVLRANGSWTRDGLRALVLDNGALDAIVHAGAPTDIPRSWLEPRETFRDIAELTAELAYTIAKDAPNIALVHTSSSNVFGRAGGRPLDESTPIAPVSPYGVAKAAAQLAVGVARGMGAARASNLIVFQALSPRASPSLVLRKITRGVAAGHVKLGTMHVVRDITHARDIARAAVMIATGEIAPGDYCCASGVGRSIREMAEIACRAAGKDFATAVEEDTSYARPNDIASLVGDVRKIRAAGWAPETRFEDLVRECLAFDRSV
jgi:GDPmannose 4,6-dehydratase